MVNDIFMSITKTSCVVNPLANGFNTFPLTINLICALFLEGYTSQSPSQMKPGKDILGDNAGG